MDREQAARDIVRSAKATRTPTSRGVWWAALIIAVVCATALAIGWFTADDAKPTQLPRPEVQPDGLAAGLAIGLVVGVAIGMVIGRRRYKT